MARAGLPLKTNAGDVEVEDVLVADGVRRDAEAAEREEPGRTDAWRDRLARRAGRRRGDVGRARGRRSPFSVAPLAPTIRSSFVTSWSGPHGRRVNALFGAVTVQVLVSLARGCGAACSVWLSVTSPWVGTKATGRCCSARPRSRLEVDRAEVLLARRAAGVDGDRRSRQTRRG